MRHGNKTDQGVKLSVRSLGRLCEEIHLLAGSFFMKQNIIIILLIFIGIRVFLPAPAKGENTKTETSITPTVTGDPWDKVVGTIAPTSGVIQKQTSSLKTVKRMECTPSGSRGEMTCQEYEATYNPNATPAPVPANVLQ